MAMENERLVPVKEQLRQIGMTNPTVRRCFDLHKYDRVEYVEMLELLALALAQQNEQMQEVLVQQAIRSPFPPTHTLRR